MPKDSWRDRIRRKPGIGQLWRVGIFVLGLLFVALGCALVVLPGPLTIPPMLVGLWIWSTEFGWAHTFFATCREKAKGAWDHAKHHPRSSTAVTLGGLLAAGAIFWAVRRYELIELARTQLFG